MCADTLFFNQINTLFIMKTLNFFILFTCLLALVSTKLNAQMLLNSTSYPTSTLQMDMPESADGFGMARASGLIGSGVAEIPVTISSASPARLAIAVYATPYSPEDIPLQIYKKPFMDTTFAMNVSFNGFVGDSVYIACGYMEGTEYVPDGGCTVVIWPHNY